MDEVLTQETQEELDRKAELERRARLKAETRKLRAAIKRELNKGRSFEVIEHPQLGTIMRPFTMSRDADMKAIRVPAANGLTITQADWDLYQTVTNLPKLKPLRRKRRAQPSAT